MQFIEKCNGAVKIDDVKCHPAIKFKNVNLKFGRLARLYFFFNPINKSD